MPRTFGTAKLVGNEWVVEAAPHVMIRLRRHFARAGKQFGELKLFASEEVSRDLLWFSERFPLEIDPRDVLEARARSFDQRTEAFAAILDGTAQPRDFELAIPPRAYQRVAAELALQARGLLIADDVGLGKTISAITALSPASSRPALVVTLTHLPRQWASELERFAPGLRVHVLKKGTPYDITKPPRRSRKQKTLARPVDPQVAAWAAKNGIVLDDRSARFPDVIVTNYHKLEGWSEELAGKIRTIVFDECQELRHSSTRRHAAAKHLAGACEMRIGLSVSGDSVVELRGGPFCDGWVGEIQDAARVVSASIGITDVSSLGVESRGWNGDGFAWKRVKSFIAHGCDQPTRALFVAGDWLRLTDDHSVFRGLSDGSVEETRTEHVAPGDVLPVDDGARWNEVDEQPIDVAELLRGHPKAQIAVDLSGLTREQLGIEKPWEWINYKRPGPFGSRLPVDVFLRNRHIVPAPTAVYLGRCKKSYFCAPTIKLSEWAYILGFFLGDGWMSGGRLAFAVEDRLVDAIVASLRSMPGIDLDPRVRRMAGKSCEVRCSNSIAATLLRSIFGDVRCHDKFIPGPWITSWPRSARLALLRGMLDSDGHEGARNRRCYYSTTSPRLARQLLSLLRSVGVVGGIHERQPTAGGTVGERQIVGRRASYIVNWSWFAMHGNHEGHHGNRRRLEGSVGRFREGVVRKVDRARATTSIVYDLEMEGHPSFTANGVLVHNSATPVYNYGTELHSIFDVLRPGALGTRQEFLEEWCRGYSDPAKAAVADPPALGSYLREAGLLIRRTRADVARELPELEKSVVHVDTDAAALDEVSASVAELARFVLSRAGAWQERGQASRELDVKLRQATGIAKAPYVAEFVKLLVEGGERVVLYAWHREVYAILQDRLKEYAPALYTGTESPTQKEEAKRAFVEGNAKVLLMSLRAGAGLDGLQHVSRTVVFGELDWSPGVHEQAIGRVHRDGQRDPVIAYYLVADEGSDPIVMDVLGIKRGQVEGVRDPERDLLETVKIDSIQSLARAYLEQRGLPLPSPTQSTEALTDG